MEKNKEHATTSERAVRLREESIELRYDPDELQTKLVIFDNQELEYDPDVERPVLQIVEDDTIIVQGKAIKLSPTKIFALNTLRISQGYGHTIQDIYDFGYKGALQGLSAATAMLRRTVNDVSTTPIIESHRDTSTTGHPTVYTLLPEVEIIDVRNELGAEYKQRLLASCVERDAKGTPIWQQDGGLAFVSTQKRGQATALFFNDFRHSVGADKMFMQFFNDEIRPRSASQAIQPLKKLPKLTREEEALLLERKERALEIYLGKGEHITDKDMAVIAEGIGAIVELIARNLDIVRAVARMYSITFASYQDLHQEGVAQLMDSVFRQKYHPDASQNMRYIIGKHIRANRGGGMMILSQKSTLPPVTVSPTIIADRQFIIDIKKSFIDEHGRQPSTTEISELSGMSSEKILGIVSVNKDVLYLDRELETGSDVMQPLGLIEPDFADQSIDEMERNAAVDFLFTSQELSDPEKVMLSLHFKLYHDALKDIRLGAQDKAVFAYPDKDGFDELVQSIPDISYMGTHIFGRSKEYAHALLRNALHTSRRTLLDLQSFDVSQYVAQSQAELTARIEEQKAEIVAFALEVSPTQRLGSKELRTLVRQGDIPFNEHHITELFGSLPSFHEACGFKPDKMAKAKAMSAGEIIDLALEINSKTPLMTNEIKVLSKHGEFVGLGAIYGKFDSIKAFRAACAEEITARRLRKA